MRILVVDDTRLNRHILRKMLEALGYVVEEASDGEECIRLVNDLEFAVIFMDYHMPNLNGAEVVKKIRSIENGQNRSSTVIIASTSEPTNEIRNEFKEAGVDLIIEKPVGLADLKNYLEQFLNESTSK